MDYLTRSYRYLFVELSDKRTYAWPLMQDPLHVTSIAVTYLLLIYYILPKYMADKKPYNLKRVIQCYNVFQVVVCTFLAYGMATSGWTSYYSWGCQLVDYSDNPLSLRMAKFLWMTHVLKIVDLIEAVFFILRKKFNQVSVLHVYHHVTILYCSWFVAKYYPGGMVSLYPLLNHIVHAVMYSYYFLSTLGPVMQKRLAKHKPKITIMQMIQFTIFLVHGSSALKSTCQVSNVLVFLLMSNLIVIFYMFYKFYTDNYLRQRRSRSKTAKTD